MNLFEDFPTHYEYAFKKEIIEMNYTRVYYITRIVFVMSIGMLIMSITINDTLSIRLSNLGLFIGSLCIFLLTVKKHPEKYLGHQSFKRWVVECFYALALLWGLTMAGYNIDNPVVFFDLTIVYILVAVYYISSHQKLIFYFSVAYFYLMFGTPFIIDAEFYLPLLISPILFMIICFYVSRILYGQVKEKFVLSETLKARQDELEQQLDQTSEALHDTEQNISREIIKTMVKVLEYYDGYTRGHSENVANYARWIAEELGFTVEHQDEIYVCGLVHDIGKILIPNHILNKPDRLTPEEYEVISKHSQYGYEMLNESKHLSRIAKIILHHHEHWDGRGYPKELKHDAIPIESQILMVADTWDAMRSERVYRKAKTENQAKDELIRCSGSQFSPIIVEAMFRVLGRDQL